ncbi:DUF1127 domain-containing protein [Sedimentitalea sp. JM2-8]|uniref:DUF1127 domain-containing protein n=1 Tax=Sedimentitalea xiamensis TaxID=3050037 RepID=A0ABT7FEW9_9RHOB|nr:DUF1127 domain-containing protein [Sedimentitalea xiamensis]MDK3073672.1 DUF1127 domain-containing protein [Sedimentitalea xiamensis]
MTYIAASRCPPVARPSLGARIARAYGLWLQRQQLRRLDDAALRDIGISRAQAEIEASRPIWDAPASWTR